MDVLSTPSAGSSSSSPSASSPSTSTSPVTGSQLISISPTPRSTTVTVEPSEAKNAIPQYLVELKHRIVVLEAKSEDITRQAEYRQQIIQRNNEVLNATENIERKHVQDIDNTLLQQQLEHSNRRILEASSILRQGQTDQEPQQMMNELNIDIDDNNHNNNNVRPLLGLDSAESLFAPLTTPSSSTVPVGLTDREFLNHRFYPSLYEQYEQQRFEIEEDRERQYNKTKKLESYTYDILITKHKLQELKEETQDKQQQLDILKAADHSEITIGDRLRTAYDELINIGQQAQFQEQQHKEYKETMAAKYNAAQSKYQSLMNELDQLQHQLSNNQQRSTTLEQKLLQKKYENQQLRDQLKEVTSKRQDDTATQRIS